MKKLMIFGLILLMAIIPFSSAAHYIVGQVNGTNVNGLNVYLYSPIFGMSFNISDIVGAAGNSRTDNIYMLDCEMLYSCSVGDELRVTIDGLNYVSTIVTGYGYDLMPTLIYEQTQVLPIPTPTNNTNVTNPNPPQTNQTQPIINQTNQTKSIAPVKKVPIKKARATITKITRRT